MPKINYRDKAFRADTLTMIDSANTIIEEYEKQGYSLTLRQLYYQFVARDLIANTVQSYSRLGDIISDARMAGLIDWNMIEDRTRTLMSLPHWDSPGDVVGACAAQFRYDKWSTQAYRVEVWIEKEALAGVISRVCGRLDVPYLACRGYMSQSEMWSASQRYLRYAKNEQPVLIVHLGDHDPSGIDMSRDIKDRLALFGVDMKTIDAEHDFNRIALNMDQVDQYKPPPNPAKTTDSRYAAYIAKYSKESWELDALEPRVLSDLVKDAVKFHRDEGAWSQMVDRELEARAELRAVAERMKG